MSEYEEKIIKKINPTFKSNIIGVHHISHNKKKSVIDIMMRKISEDYFFNESWVIGGSNKYFESLIQVAIKENHEVEYIINNENSFMKFKR